MVRFRSKWDSEQISVSLPGCSGSAVNRAGGARSCWATWTLRAHRGSATCELPSGRRYIPGGAGHDPFPGTLRVNLLPRSWCDGLFITGTAVFALLISLQVLFRASSLSDTTSFDVLSLSAGHRPMGCCEALPPFLAALRIVAVSPVMAASNARDFANHNEEFGLRCEIGGGANSVLQMVKAGTPGANVAFDGRTCLGRGRQTVHAGATTGWGPRRLPVALARFSSATSGLVGASFRSPRSRETRSLCVQDAHSGFELCRGPLVEGFWRKNFVYVVVFVDQIVC